MTEPATASATGMIGFTITGDFLTDHARALVQEGTWEAGLSFLVDNLGGMTYDLAIAILKGEQRLTGATTCGSNTIAAEADPDAGAHVAFMCWAYAGRVKHGKHWYEPYAIVGNSFGPPDAMAAMRGELPAVRYLPASGGGSRDGAWCAATYRGEKSWSISPMDNRVAYYMDNPRSDMAARVDVIARVAPHILRGVTVLFQITSAPPVWFRDASPRNAVDAINEYRKAGKTWDVRGYHVDSQPIQERLALAHAEEDTQTDTIIQTARGNTGNPALIPTVTEMAHAHAEVVQAEKDLDDERAWIATLRSYRKAVSALAGPIDGPGWITLTIMPGAPAEYTIRVPRAPFTCWSLWRTAGRHLMPTYTPVCPSGLRLYGDDAYHSDWLLFAAPTDERANALGSAYHDPEVRSASYHTQHEIQRELLGFTAAVLSGKGAANGKVIHPEPGDTIPAGAIVVLPNARPEWESVVRSAAATIVPVGGELCHLAVVAGEAGRIIMRVPNCLALYPVGTQLRVETDKGRVEISAIHVRNAWGELEELVTDSEEEIP